MSRDEYKIITVFPVFSEFDYNIRINEIFLFQAATALLCECEILTSMYTKESSNQLCRALDVYENRLVKCANDVDDVPLLRCGKAKPFQALCVIHFERMIRHNACPTCGSFCTQVKEVIPIFLSFCYGLTIFFSIFISLYF